MSILFSVLIQIKPQSPLLSVSVFRSYIPPESNDFDVSEGAESFTDNDRNGDKATDTETYLYNNIIILHYYYYYFYDDCYYSNHCYCE